MFSLAKKYYQLADQLDEIREKFEENDTDFDFFRFRPPRKELSQQYKEIIKAKFRLALQQFFREYKANGCRIPRALELIKEFQAERITKTEEINKLRTAQTLSMIYQGAYGEQIKQQTMQAHQMLLAQSQAQNAYQN